MNIEDFREYCLRKKGVTEGFPFDADTLVFKVGGKMFALTNLSDFDAGIALKCEPEKAIQLREDFPDDITGAYHMNKTHWNNVKPNGSVPVVLLKELIDQSYLLVYNGLSRSQKLEVDIDDEKTLRFMLWPAGLWYRLRPNHRAKLDQNRLFR